MADNPFTESGLIQAVRDKGISVNDIDDIALGGLINISLMEYQAFRPQLVLSTASTCITTVAGEPSYAKPTGATFIREVFWQPSYQTEEMDDLWTQIVLGNQYNPDPTILMLDHLKIARYNQIFKGSWKILDDEIFLIPTPDSVYKVAVLYATQKTLDELDQINDFRLVDLVYYNALLAVGTKKLTGGGFRAGQYSQSESVGRETVRVAEKGLERTKLLLANAATMRRS